MFQVLGAHLHKQPARDKSHPKRADKVCSGAPISYRVKSFRLFYLVDNVGSGWRVVFVKVDRLSSGSLLNEYKVANTASSKRSLGRSLSCSRLIWVQRKTWTTIRLVHYGARKLASFKEDFLSSAGTCLSTLDWLAT